MDQVFKKKNPVKPGEQTLLLILRVFAYSTIGITLSIVFILFSESFSFFKVVPLTEFLGSTKWTPLLEPRHFGVLPLVYGTIFVAVGALVIAVPLGVLIAVYLSEYASARSRQFLKPTLELLAGIPSVVFGFFALTVITPLLRQIDPDIQVFNALSAAIVLSIMVLPLIASISDDAIRSVPNSMRESGYALGATKSEVILAVVIPAALSGIISSCILAFSRAIGETMAVTLAAGATPQLTLSMKESIQTITAYIVQVSMGDTPHGTIEYQSLFAVAVVLFLIVVVVNMSAQLVVKRFQRKYV